VTLATRDIEPLSETPCRRGAGTRKYPSDRCKKYRSGVMPYGHGHGDETTVVHTPGVGAGWSWDVA
jgi:hypothetical protein